MTSSGLRVKPETEASLYVGAIATGLVGLLPYVNVFIFPAYVVGAMVAVWHAVTRRGRSLQFKDGAKLGFLSTFLGSMVAVVLVDLIWVFFDYQLWQRQNEQLMLGIFRSFASAATVDTMSAALAENHGKVFRWYLLLFQLLGNAVFCGIFGTLSGLLGVKIFRSAVPRRDS
ncbi:MAG: hypothetical protein M3Q46_04970 [Verrucomicrobiota bacterium]|nr:hypothetical protein [Verrucomicrobiota bacterium]